MSSANHRSVPATIRTRVSQPDARRAVASARQTLSWARDDLPSRARTFSDARRVVSALAKSLDQARRRLRRSPRREQGASARVSTRRRRGGRECRHGRIGRVDACARGRDVRQAARREGQRRPMEAGDERFRSTGGRASRGEREACADLSDAARSVCLGVARSGARGAMDSRGWKLAPRRARTVLLGALGPPANRRAGDGEAIAVS